MLSISFYDKLFPETSLDLNSHHSDNILAVKIIIKNIVLVSIIQVYTS